MNDLFSVVEAKNGAIPAPFVVVEIPCIPHGKGRPRGRIVKPRGGPAFVSFYTDADTVEFENLLRGYARRAMAGKYKLDGPLAIRMFFIMPIPKSWPQRDKDAAVAGTKYHLNTPDVDNLKKSVLDAFNSIVWFDDKQIVKALACKEYGESTGVIAEIYQLP